MSRWLRTAITSDWVEHDWPYEEDQGLLDNFKERDRRENSYRQSRDLYNKVRDNILELFKQNSSIDDVMKSVGEIYNNYMQSQDKCWFDLRSFYESVVGGMKLDDFTYLDEFIYKKFNYDYDKFDEFLRSIRDAAEKKSIEILKERGY